MRQYLDLVNHVLNTGTRKENRTGVDTISTFGYYYEHDMRDGFPLLTTKEISWKNIVIENLWFLSGAKDISFLRRHGCKFWDPWADEQGFVPSAYGNFWRRFPVHQQVPGECGGPDETDIGFNDQIRWVLDEMRRNPMSRRMVISAWAPGNAQTSKLPPCHCLFAFNVQNDLPTLEDKPWEVCAGYFSGTDLLGVVWAKDEDVALEKARHKFGPQVDTDGTEALYVREPIESRIPEYEAMRGSIEPKQRLCLHLTQRSCDTALGVPYNLAGYAFILQVFSHMSGLEPGIFGHTLIDAHVYTSKPDGSMAEYDHVPKLREQTWRDPKSLPRLTIDPTIRDLQDIEALLDPKLTTEEVMSHFVLEGYEPYPKINFKVAV